jgi:hypothetical protein
VARGGIEPPTRGFSVAFAISWGSVSRTKICFDAVAVIRAAEPPGEIRTPTLGSPGL